MDVARRTGPPDTKYIILKASIGWAVLRGRGPRGGFQNICLDHTLNLERSFITPLYTHPFSENTSRYHEAPSQVSRLSGRRVSKISLLNCRKDCIVFTTIQVDWFLKALTLIQGCGSHVIKKRQRCGSVTKYGSGVGFATLNDGKMDFGLGENENR